METNDFNLENIEKQWDKQNISIEIPANLEKLKIALDPLEKIRKNMKWETSLNLILFPLLSLIPFIPFYHITGISRSVYFLILFLFFLSSVPIYYSFFQFYKKTINFSINSKDNLIHSYYEIKSIIFNYKSLFYVMLPYGIILFMIMLPFGKIEDFMMYLQTFPNSLKTNNVIFLLVFTSIYILFSFWFINWWINYYYGKFLTEIKIVLDDFEENC